MPLCFGRKSHWNSGTGQQVQITAGAGLNAASIGGIGGDYATSTASAFYTSAASKFTFTSASTVPAYMDMGPLTVRNATAAANGVTITPPTALSASYTLTLLTGLPASTKMLTVSSSGALGVYDIDNSTITVSSGILQVPANGITRAQLGAVGQQMSSSSGIGSQSCTTTPTTINNLTVTLITTGRPVMVMLQPDGGSTPGMLIFNVATFGSGGYAEPALGVSRDGSLVGRIDFGVFSSGNRIVPGSMFLLLDVPAAGSHTYNLQAYWASTFNVSGTLSLTYQYVKLVAYEL